MISIAGSEFNLPTSISLYEETLPETKEILSQIAQDPQFGSRTSIKTVEVAVKVLKNGQLHSYHQLMHQHKWSWPIFLLLLPLMPVGPPLYLAYHNYQQVYSSQKICDLVKKGLEIDLSPEDVLVACTITVTVAHHGIFGVKSYQAEKKFQEFT